MGTKTKTCKADLPKWDADMDYWISDDLTVKSNPNYKSCDDGNIVSGQIEQK